MTSGLDPRVPFRDSGVPWLGEIPAHWGIIQLKFITRSLQTGPFGSQLHAEEYITGGIPLVNPSHLNSGRICADNRVSVDEATAERLAVHRLFPGDVVFARRGELGRCGVVEPSQAGWLCGTGSLRARLRLDIVDPYYLMLVFTETRMSDVLTFESVGSTMDNLNTEILGACQFGMPPITEQRAIVAYFATETAKLDALVAAKERVLKLLAEKRRALITRAVTRGLDPRALLRDSGLPWLGEIPAHWGIIKLKHIAMISYGVGDELDKSLTSGTPLISLPNVAIDGTLNLSDLGWADLNEVERPGLLLKRGDLLFNWRNGSSEHLAKTAYFDADGEFTHVGFLLRIRFDLCRFESRFYQAFLNALRATGFFLYSRAMVNNTFNQTELENLSVVVPPLSEQVIIVAHIATETAKLDALRAATERTIALLKERRAALIAAAVTGRIFIPASLRT